MHKLYTRSLIGVGECRKGLHWMGVIGKEKRVMTIITATWNKKLGHTSMKNSIRLISLIVFHSLKLVILVPKLNML